MSTLQFSVLSGGDVKIDLAKCEECRTKACVNSEDARRQCEVLRLARGRPELRVEAAEAQSGACTECLVCETNCRFEGRRAITISLPMPDLELALEAQDQPPVYLRW
jgi:hypothetical protein